MLKLTVLEFYKEVSFDGWGGASGHDSVLIAYDALLGCKGNWVEFCHRGTDFVFSLTG